MTSPDTADARFDRIALLTLLVGTSLAYAMLLLREPVNLSLDIDGYGRLAINCGEFGVYGYQTQPTAYRAPLYPSLLAGLNCAGLLSPATVSVIHGMLGILTVWLVTVVGAQLQLGRWRFVAGALVAVDPILVRQLPLLMTETLATFLSVAALSALIALAVRPNSWRALGAGALLGLSILCRPTFLVWAALVPFALAWLLPQAAQRVQKALLVAAATSCVLAPWGIRNALQVGRPVITTTHGGWTLLLANNLPFYRHMLTDPFSAWDADAFNSLLLDPTRTSVKDEIALDRRYYGYAWDCIRAQPTLFVFSALYRESRLWGVMPLALTEHEPPRVRFLRYGVAAFYTAELVLLAVGLWFLRRRLIATPWLFGLLLAMSFSAVHAFYWTDLRMRAPVVPFIACGSAAGIAWICGKWSRRKVPAQQ